MSNKVLESRFLLQTQKRVHVSEGQQATNCSENADQNKRLKYAREKQDHDRTQLKNLDFIQE